MIDLTELIRLSRKYWYIYIICIAICSVAGLFYYLHSAPVFQVSSTMMVRSSDATRPTSQDEMISMLGYGGVKQAGDEVEIIRSRQIIGAAVDQLGLQTTVQKKGRRFWTTQYPVRDLSVVYDTMPQSTVNIKLRVLNNGYSISVKKDWRHKSKMKVEDLDQPISTCVGTIRLIASSPLTAGNRYRLRTGVRQSVIQQFRSRINVTRLSRESDVINLSMNSDCPQMAVDLLNTLMAQYNDQSASDKNLVAANTERFIEQRLAIVAAQLDSLEMALQTYKSAHHISDLGSTADLYMRTNEQYEQQVRDIRTQQQVLDFVEDFVRNETNETDLIPANLGISDPTLTELIKSYNSETLNYNRLKRNATDNNPMMQQKAEQLDLIRRNILIAVTNVRKGLNIQMQNLRDNGKDYAGLLESVPAQERGYLELKRQHDMVEEVYTFLSTKMEDNRLMLTSSAMPAKMVDKAQVNPEKVSPRLSHILLIVLILGLGLPLAFFFLKLMINEISPRETERDRQIRAWGVNKYWVIILLLGLTVSSCSILQAVHLKDCTYEYEKLSDMTFLGMPKGDLLSISGIAKVTKALLGKTETVPLGFTVHLKVSNPNSSIAAMERLYYSVSLDSIHIADGSVTEPFVVVGNSSADLPLKLDIDLKQVLNGESKPTVTKVIKQFIGMESEPTQVNVLLRPVIKVGGTSMGVPKGIPLSFMYGGKEGDTSNNKK